MTNVLLYDQSSGKVATYEVIPDSPYLRVPPITLDLGAGWDLVEPLVIGNQPHVMCYRSSDGQFGFFPIQPDLSVDSPFKFSRAHEPGITRGFSTVKPFTIGGGVGYLGYNQTTGMVAIYSLSVTATSPAGVPPLASRNMWSHQWARGWTRFAFFQFASENFFLKTNVVRPNVNVDYVLHDLAQGTLEVGTHLDLQDALTLDLVGCFVLGGGDPHFFAYKSTGEISLYRINGDGLGWTRLMAATVVAGASAIVPVRIADRVRLVFCVPVHREPTAD